MKIPFNPPTISLLLRKACHIFLALFCLVLVIYTAYQMLFASFSLAGFAQRALLTAITAAVILLLHRLLFYRLPPAYSLCLWLVVLVQMAGISLAALGLFDHGLENQLPQIAVQMPPQIQISDTTPALQTTPSQPEEVTLSYPGGAQQTVSYAQSVAQTVQLIWQVGAVALCAWFWGTYLVFTARLPKGAQDIPQNVTETLQTAKKALQIKQDVRLVFTANDGPLLLGILHPCIVLPTTDFTLQPTSEPQTKDLYFILLHELTHLKNGDNLWSAIALIALATQWYNPLVWLCFIHLKRDIERRCDDTVATLTQDKKAYATVLLKTIQPKEVTNEA